MKLKAPAAAVLIALLAAVALAGCGGSGERDGRTSGQSTGTTAGGETEPPESRLADTEWVLDTIHGRRPIGEDNLTLEFDGGSFGGDANCNSFSGDYEATDAGEMEVRQLAQTEVGCPGEEGRQEREYTEAVADAETYTLRDGRLEIREGGRTTLVYERRERVEMDPDDLIGTRWKLRTLDGEPPLRDSTLTLRFTSQTRYEGYAGCDGFDGRYDAEGDRVSSGVLGMEEAGCIRPGGYDEQQSEYITVLSDSYYRLGEDSLKVEPARGGEFVFDPLPQDAEIERRTNPWELRYFIEDGRRTPALENTRITLEFDEGTMRESGGVISGSAGCNDYGADYEYGNHFNIEGYDVTQQGCIEPPGILKQEERYLDVLEDVSNYSQKADGRLIFETGDGRALIFGAPEGTPGR